MTVKEHYDNHLGNFYSWMCGNFEEKQKEMLQFFTDKKIEPQFSKLAIDLGAGHGIQATALAMLGFNVYAIDFNEQLLQELKLNAKELPVKIINSDIRDVIKYKDQYPELILCFGDTVSHLESKTEIEKLFNNVYEILMPKGKFILSFRDYGTELTDEARFIPVKSEQDRILTCFLEYFPEKVRVTDIHYTKDKENWKQAASSYFKVRITKDYIKSNLEKAGFTLCFDDTVNRLITLIAEK